MIRYDMTSQMSYNAKNIIEEAKVDVPARSVSLVGRMTSISATGIIDFESADAFELVDSNGLEASLTKKAKVQ